MQGFTAVPYLFCKTDKFAFSVKRSRANYQMTKSLLDHLTERPRKRALEQEILEVNPLATLIIAGLAGLIFAHFISSI